MYQISVRINKAIGSNHPENKFGWNSRGLRQQFKLKKIVEDISIIFISGKDSDYKKVDDVTNNTWTAFLLRPSLYLVKRKKNIINVSVMQRVTGLSHNQLQLQLYHYSDLSENEKYSLFCFRPFFIWMEISRSAYETGQEMRYVSCTYVKLNSIKLYKLNYKVSNELQKRCSSYTLGYRCRCVSGRNRWFFLGKFVNMSLY